METHTKPDQRAIEEVCRLVAHAGTPFGRLLWLRWMRKRQKQRAGLLPPSRSVSVTVPRAGQVRYRRVHAQRSTGSEDGSDGNHHHQLMHRAARLTARFFVFGANVAIGGGA